MPGAGAQEAFSDAAFQGWKVALCLSGVASVDTLCYQLVLEYNIWAQMMCSELTIGL